MRRGVRLALDWGDARIGVAACDPDAVLAFPYGTVAAGPDELTALVALVRGVAPLEVVVGLPRSLSGGEGPAALKARDRAEALAGLLGALDPPVGVRLVDERLTTVTAARRLREGGRKARDQRQVIDAAAAVTILEHALAGERARSEPAGELVSLADQPDRRATRADGGVRQSGDTQ